MCSLLFVFGIPGEPVNQQTIVFSKGINSKQARLISSYLLVCLFFSLTKSKSRLCPKKKETVYDDDTELKEYLCRDLILVQRHVKTSMNSNGCILSLDIKAEIEIVHNKQ